jgi:D-galactarolactone cycloisomerase
MTLANCYGVLIITHVWGSGIALAAVLHALAIVPPTPHTANPVLLKNEPVVKFDRTHNSLRDELLVEKFDLVDGHVEIPQRSGLGVTMDEEALKRFEV